MKLVTRPRKRFTAIVGSLIILILFASGYWYWNQTDDSAKQLVTAKVIRGDIENLVTATGTLQPKDYVDVGAQVSGQLKSLKVEVGTHVKKGDLLGEIDPTVFLAKVDASRAQLRYQKAQLKDRQSQLTLAEINYQRAKSLFNRQATTEEAMLNAEANLRSAQAQIEMIQAQIDQTDSSLRADEANLQYAQIFAPMDGTIVSISAKQGQTLNANQQAPVILRIADLSTMTVQTQVSEADVSKIQPGIAVYFTTLGSQRRWNGELNKIEPTPQVVNNVVLYNALFDIPNPRNRLMSQMTAQVFFVLDSAKDTLLVPLSALTFQERNRDTREDGATGNSESLTQRRERNGDTPPRQQRKRLAIVEVLLADGKREKRQVEVGVTNRVQAQILSGLEENETVITTNKPSNRANRPNGNTTRPTGTMGPRLG